ncbi:MAG: 3-hydroxyacyl-CoA dehydrogenase family protein [Acidothermus cellulolyticus]|nr:3-hydroxyacyl-CoA dehydrogenase family protein [Acidothermus cellulolyticus]
MTTPLPPVVAVIGGGVMGSGIAGAFLRAGCDVILIERDEAAAEQARDRVERQLQRAGGAAVDDALARLTVGSDVARIGQAGLIVEAVVEDVMAKRQVLAAAERHAPNARLLATNTSSISIDELAAGMARPDRFLGLHFFNPVLSSALVEVVVGTATASTAAAYAVDVVRALAKQPVTVRNSPGFASSRLGVLLALEAIRMVEEGVATPEDIDTVMTLGYRHPVGPLRLTDIVGLDVRLAIAEYLAGRLGPRFEPPRLLRDLVARGSLGRKAGRGFYVWPAESAGGGSRECGSSADQGD